MIEDGGIEYGAFQAEIAVGFSVGLLIGDRGNSADDLIEYECYLLDMCVCSLMNTSP